MSTSNRSDLLTLLRTKSLAFGRVFTLSKRLVFAHVRGYSRVASRLILDSIYSDRVDVGSKHDARVGVSLQQLKECLFFESVETGPNPF